MTSPNHVGVIMSRLRKDPSSSVDYDTLVAIARGAGVAVHWLATGKGWPEESDELRADRALDQSEPGLQAVPWDTDPVLGNLPNWPALYAGARAKRPGHPQWVWDATAESRPHMPGVEASVGVIVLVSDLALEFVAPPPPGTKDGRAHYRQVMRGMSTTALRNLAAHAAKNGTT